MLSLNNTIILHLAYSSRVAAEHPLVNEALHEVRRASHGKFKPDCVPCNAKKWFKQACAAFGMWLFQQPADVREEVRQLAVESAARQAHATLIVHLDPKTKPPVSSFQIHAP